mmetsp:Transcript_16737/g.25797  ORF Transcript_16737/g.25797 Transcript_16737/m.25797 type:complete len:130 (-) Transcript_16737:967-1356(-)
MFPYEIRKEMETNTYEKLYAMRDKFAEEIDLKKTVEHQDKRTATLPKTVNHIKKIYPASTLSMQKKFNKGFYEKSQGNAFQLMSLMDGRLEKAREDTEMALMKDKGGKQSFKSKIFNTQKKIYKEYDRI